MRRFAWLTDVHLNFLPHSQVELFLAEVRRAQLDGVLLTGDIAEAHDLLAYLELLDDNLSTPQLGLPIYFVLGNHDFYHGSIHAVRAQVTELCQRRPNLHYLSTDGVCEVTPDLGLVGHDGWADGRLGYYLGSLVSMTDFKVINELIGLNKLDRWAVLKSLADDAAAHLARVLPAALDRYPKVMLLTHVPPWRGACWHAGRLSDEQWAPHFTCQAVGQTIESIMREYPARELTVLCGHTHGNGQFRPLPNVLVLTGGAEYTRPTVQCVFEID